MIDGGVLVFDSVLMALAIMSGWLYYEQLDLYSVYESFLSTL